MEWTFDFGLLFIVFLLSCLLLCFPYFLAFFGFRFPLLLSLLSKVLHSIIMSSFLSDFIIGLDRSDSGGSIQQPIMDREVILISGFSSKDTRRGASDSESSSSERERTSCQTSGGISCPCGRARPSVAVGEPVSVTVILPSFASGGARRAGGDRDVRSSPCIRPSVSFGSLSSTPAIAGYEWVRDDLLKYKFCLTLATSVTALQHQMKLVNPKDSVSWSFRLAGVMTSHFLGRHLVVHLSSLCTDVCLRSWVSFYP